MIVALLARGHLLVEGVPGLAKTMAIKTLAQAVGGDFKRIQFTPDLVPSDLVGTRIYNQQTGEFTTSLGPVFTNLLLADEINRAPAKVQSALLEVMQERQVTIGHETHPVPEPFLVLATQNPIETEGTYALPEAQVDRFMLKVLVGYPSPTEEFAIVERMTGPLERVRQILTTDELLALQRAATRSTWTRRCTTTPYGSSWRRARRTGSGCRSCSRYITYGASPRASINLILTARALAFVRGRGYVLPEDILDMAADVMRHRSCSPTRPSRTRHPRPHRVHDPGPGPAARRPPPRACSRRRPRLSAILQRLDWQVVRKLDGLLQGEYRCLFRGPAWTSPACASTSPGTTCATSTGTSRRGHARTSASTTRTARSRPGSCWT